MAEPAPDVADLVFAIEGHAVPRGYRGALAAALVETLPWLAGTPGAAVHRLNLSAGGGSEALLSRRTRLTLRLPRERLGAAAALCGRQLAVGEHVIAVGEAEVRELRPFHTLYAHVVAGPSPEAPGELEFQQQVQAEIAARGWPCRAIFGRPVSLDGGRLHGAPVMLDGLAAETATAVMCQGLGAHPLLGCGVFVPHKSAAAVGSG